MKVFSALIVGVLGGLGYAWYTEPEPRTPYCLEAAFKEIGDRQYFLMEMVTQQALPDGGMFAVFVDMPNIVVIGIASDAIMAQANIPQEKVITTYQCIHNGLPMNLKIHQDIIAPAEGF